MASSTKLSMPRASCCAKMTPGIEPSIQRNSRADSASTKPMGIPPTRQMTKPASMASAASGSSTSKPQANRTAATMATTPPPASTSRPRSPASRCRLNSAKHAPAAPIA